MSGRNSTQEENPIGSFNTSGEYSFDEASVSVKLSVAWTSAKLDSICDLDINVLLYDENARFIEKIDIDNDTSQDEGVRLEADIDSLKASKVHLENVNVNFNLLSMQTSCMLFLITGGQRNFVNVENVSLRCTDAFDTSSIDFSTSNFVQTVNSHLHASSHPATEYFKKSFKTRRDCDSVIPIVLYKSGRHSSGKSSWTCQLVLKPLFDSNEVEKDKICSQTVINLVPSLAKYRSHVFPTTKSLCSSLSSLSLPYLKEQFSRGDGLQINAFTKTLLSQLYKCNSKVLEPSEAAYTVAMLYDMFHQIDFNENGSVDWDEFTTFCIYTGLVSSGAPGEDYSNMDSVNPLDNYSIEYVMDKTTRDKVNTLSHSQLVQVRHFPETKRLMCIPETKDCFIVFDEQFNEVSHVDPNEVFNHRKEHNMKEKENFVVYDVCYIPFRDLYCYCASDHTIVMMKPHTDSSGEKIHYSLFNRLYHAYKHVKLCWSEMSKILCSVSVSNDIFGWSVDGKEPVFQISRHKELITDFLAIDDLSLFATCSMDKRVVLWSQSTYRVRGVLAGHKRGIKVMSYARNCLLTAGFELDARCWSLTLQENTLILRGHRAPIAAVKIMHLINSYDEDLRALTVDDRGEFRLWDIRVKSGSDIRYATSLRCFSIHDCEHHLAQVRFLAIPYDAHRSKEGYSNFICASSHLIQYNPEKVCKEFMPCSHMEYSSGNASLILSVDRSIFKYDIITGHFQSCIPNLDKSEIPSFCADDRHRIYIGCNNGEVLLVKYATGQVLSRLKVHHRAVTALSVIKLGRGCNIVYAGSIDGALRSVDDTCGSLAVNNTMNRVFGDRVPIALVRNLPSVKMVVVVSKKSKWGVLTDSNLKIIFSFEENMKVMDVTEVKSSTPEDSCAKGISTVVICTAEHLRVYVLDFKHINYHVSHVLGSTNTLLRRCYSHINLIDCSNSSVNYAEYDGDRDSLNLFLAASSDDGYISAWSASSLRENAISFYFIKNPKVMEVYMEQQFYLEFEAATNKQNRKKQLKAYKTAQKYKDTMLLAEGCGELVMPSSSSDDDQDDNLGEVSSVGEDSLFSLTSKAGIVKFDTSSGVNVSVMAQTVRCDDDGNVGSAPQNPISSKGRKALLLKQESVRKQMDANGNRPTQIRDVPPEVCWKAHDGFITTLVALNEHGCLVTSGYDGFCRIWNLQEKCLGVMPLPNLTEKMKEYNRQHPLQYRFIMEKIKVLRNHEKLASKLTNDILSESSQKTKGVAPMRREVSFGKIMSAMAKHEAQTLSKNAQSEKDEDRAKILLTLSKDSVEVDHGSNSLPGSSITAAGLERPHTSPASVGVESTGSSFPAISVHSGGSSSRPATSSSQRGATAAKRFQEDSIYSSNDLWIGAQDITKKHSDIKPFSDKSVSEAVSNGILDTEGQMKLLNIRKDGTKVKAYDRAVEKVLLKNCKKSTQVKVSCSASISPNELIFGSQKGMYSNANKVINSQRIKSPAAERHRMALAMIKNSAKTQGSMIASVDPREQLTEHIYLPDEQEKSSEESDSHKPSEKSTQLTLSPSRLAHRRAGMVVTPLSRSDSLKNIDRFRIAQWMQKVTDAEVEAVPEWEARDMKRREDRERAKKKKQRLQSVTHNHYSMKVLESKLTKSIISFHRVIEQGVQLESKPITTRDLLPYYRASDFKNFLNVYLSVDEEFTGEVNKNQWVHFFSRMRKTVSRKTALVLFKDLDKDADGLLTAEELTEYFFSKADEAQIDLMKGKVMNIIRKNKAVGGENLTESDLNQIFEYYDQDFVGFIRVRSLKDRIKGFNLPGQANASLYAHFDELYDDDMINLAEFVRIFRPYLVISQIS